MYLFGLLVPKATWFKSWWKVERYTWVLVGMQSHDDSGQEEPALGTTEAFRAGVVKAVIQSCRPEKAAK